MKTIKSTTAIALLFATALSFANNTPKNVTTTNEVSGIYSGSESIRESHEPFFRKADGKLYVNFFNQDMDKVQIKVIDSENRVVYKETLKDQLVIEKAFNFKNARTDNYKVVIMEGNATYYEYFLVK